MSDPAAPEQEYFHQLEAQFARLRGAAVLLSPADWKVAQDWWQRGIPVDLVVRSMELVLARRAERLTAGGGSRRIHSLRYFGPAVDVAWEELRALTAPGHIAEVEPLDIPARLDALAAALPPDLTRREHWQARLRGLSGAPPEIEAALTALDAEILAGSLADLASGASREIEEAAEKRLAALAKRLPAVEVERAREGLRTRLLRQRLGLPVLSLFAAEAAPPDEPRPS